MDFSLVYKKSKGRSLRIVVLPLDVIEVRVPKRMSLLMAKAFMLSKKELVKNLAQRQEKKLLELRSEFDARLFEVHKEGVLMQYKKDALAFVHHEIGKVANRGEFSFQKIQIKNTSSRWGSCSSKGTLSFHYKILFLPKELQHYLLIHELCHLKEMNHSKRFWTAVEKEFPLYEEARKKLKSIPLM